MSATEALVALTRSSYDEIPDEVVSRAKTSIRDVLGVAIYGSQHEVGDRIGRYVDRASPGDGATVLGRGTASAPGAALANGTFAHAIDYDDTFESMVLHPSAPVFPAALAAAEAADATGRDLLTGYILGVEAEFRVGHSVYPSHYDHGWHHTGTIGSFGAAAAAASVLDLSAAATTNAFGIVASGSSALKKNFGSMTKPLHPGHAAQTGLRAAMLAAEGFTADEAILDGDMGYGVVMSPDGSYDPTVIEEGRDSWGVLDNGFKPYPSGVISHAAMEATRRLVAEHDLTPETVERMTVTLDEAASEMLIHAQPEDELQAKFSIEFCLAAVLREGDAGVQEFTDEYVTAPETRAVIERVERDFEPDLFGGEFAGYGARVVVETTDGETYTAEEQRAPGSPTNPLPEARWEAKFDDCVAPVLDEAARVEIIEAIDTLEAAGSLDRLVAASRPD
jgi:2-methylcitrate dehydratase PrpD